MLTYPNGVTLYNAQSLINVDYPTYLNPDTQPKLKNAVTWINLDDRVAVENGIGVLESLDLHPLVIEQAQEQNRRPSLSQIGNDLFIISKMMYYEEESLIFEQVSLIFRAGLLVTVGTYAGDVFDPIRERLMNPEDPLRDQGTDYLLYTLLDRMVDAYFEVIDQIEEDVENLEERVLTNHSSTILHEIRTLKRDLLDMHKHIWPLRDVLSRLSHGEKKIPEGTQIYLRDVQDHLYQVLDSVETLREVLSSLVDIYLSNASIKMNEIMKVLTVISTIFIPLTFIAGVYGMNFKVMPEIEWPYGYLFALILMGLVALAMIVFFKRKKWF
jgi:magnesium transporter